MRLNEVIAATDDARAHRLLLRLRDLSCSLCKPHRLCNGDRWAKHGPRKPRKKDHRGRVG